jgi:hypothetical protein
LKGFREFALKALNQFVQPFSTGTYGNYETERHEG